MPSALQSHCRLLPCATVVSSSQESNAFIHSNIEKNGKKKASTRKKKREKNTKKPTKNTTRCKCKTSVQDGLLEWSVLIGNDFDVPT